MCWVFVAEFPWEELDRVRARVEEARNARNLARLALEQHKKEHRC
jgi:hypothetical protein